MLEYEKQIFLDILQEDGLVVAAKGLGLDSVIVNLLKVYCDPGNLVFLIGTEGKHQEWLLKKLKESGVNPQPRVVSGEVGGTERQLSYLDGGLWFVPPRILVVDLIKKRVPIDLITGFIVCKAHNILRNHQDAFVLRLYRQGNKTGFIKAFSDQAPAFKGGFNKVEQIMKALFLRNLLLWPRYHAAVKSSLNQCKPTVIELHLEMTSKMVQLQNALLDLIKSTVQELKRLNPTLDTEEVTVENAISDIFYKVLHSQLDPVWHALSERTKALLTDLKLFHSLILSLLTEDSVSYYALTNSQRKADCAIKGSGWHLLPSAEVVFQTAKQRVFPKENSEQIDPEPNPKWLVLSEALAEIHREYSKEEKPKVEKIKDEDVEKKLEDMFGIENSNDSVGDKSNDSTSDKTKSKESKSDPDKSLTENPADILILTRDERNCSQLQMYLTLGSKELMEIQYSKYFPKKFNSRKVNENTGDKNTEKENEKSDAKEEEDNVDFSEEMDEDTYTLSLSQVGFSQLEKKEKINIAGYFEDSMILSQKSGLLSEDTEQTQATQSLNGKPPPVIVIKSFRKNIMNLPLILEEQKPRWVIIYDAEMTIVRQLEVYQRNNPKIALKVYFLVFGGTIEEQAYLTSLRKEKEAFDFLIEEKSRIVIPEDINDFPGLQRDDERVNELLAKTRKGGMESPKKGVSKIIVDIREFRSELPALIHSRGIEIEPLMITIGDYILTPDICLERKSVSDLIQSLNSGRLYNQAMAMTRHYSRPMLLIEFDKDKPFDLQDRYYLSTDASSDSLVTKLQLLTLHFPQLRLVWSPNPHATAQLFEELKIGHPEPDSATALGLGVDQEATDEDKFNPAVQKFISNLPGITNKNIHAILLKGQSLDYLKNLTKEELGDIVQNSGEGEILYNAFHKSYNPDESSSSVTVKGKFRPGGLRGKRKRFH